MSRSAALQKTTPALLDFSLEAEHNFALCGIDEVGRGPLAGPVMACCVHIPRKVQNMKFWDVVTDSKKLTAKKRETLYLHIKEHCQYGLAEASAEEIDELNIHHATLLAMKRAYHKMRDGYGTAPEHALIDGRFVPKIDCRAMAIKKGDSKCISIAAASIIAKVTRDRLMAELAAKHPHYGWERNAGYGTPQHLDGLKKFGVTEHHRRSFSPVRDAL